MEKAVIHFIILGVISGLTSGLGLLPDVLHAAIGESVTFTTSLTPTDKPFLTVGWTFDGRNIISFSGTNTTGPEYKDRITLFMSTGSLELRNVALNDHGEYSVNIFPFGEPQKTGSTILDVHVRVSDVIATASNTDLVEFNSSVRLSCSASGSSLSFLWLNGSSEVTGSDKVQLADGGANLTIVNVTRYDKGPFSCHVYNPVSNGTSEPINFNVSYGPENLHLEISPLLEHYKEGSNVTLTCLAVSRPPAQFTLLLNGGLQSDTGPQFNLTTIQESQSGNYSCQAFNSKTLRYESSSPAVISVLIPVSNLTATASNTDLVEFNSSVRLSCSASGSSLSFLWLNGSSEVTGSDKVQLADGGANLTIVHVTRYDKGPFKCQVSNPVSNDISEPINFNISYGPQNVRITGPSTKYPKEKLTLTCSADSKPRATYIWRLNGTKIHNSAVFTKNNVERSDSGSYTCEAMNMITGRKSSAVHKLSVTDKESGGLSDGAIAGIVIACLVVAAGAAGGYYIYKKKNNNKAEPFFGNTEAQNEENAAEHENTQTQ